MVNIGFLSLGCPRNLVDTELILGKLSEKGYGITDEIGDCDVAIINTCGFIEDAKREAIDLILQAAELKKEAKIKKLIVCGCLSQRYPAQLKKEIPQIDAILGIDGFKSIDKAIKFILEDKSPCYINVNRPEVLYSHKDKRLRTTPSHYSYVKIAEGCCNRCSYCAIYKIRGDFRSRGMASVVAEVKALTKNATLSELNIIAQDTTSYGIDNYGEFKLPLLLKKIASLGRSRWIRLLYTHPRHFSDALIDTIAQEVSICKYIDLPIQHINDRILKRMNRRIKRAQIEKLIQKIRQRIPGVALRTSIIVGFPGETEEEFKELLAFIKDVRFERLGAFVYSREEDTPAYQFKGQLSDKIKKDRFKTVMQFQQEISGVINEGFKGRELEVLIDEKDGACKDRYVGRTQYDAPEVDGEVYIYSKKRLKAGDFVTAMITDTMEYDLAGTVVKATQPKIKRRQKT